ncbi:helix-turn-helix domain-containing protein [Kitasatospora kifunensis]|uniref:Transcriptional regulator GlxA family with amidase domain n=1 Tax=Kitasatospora kifunensis TaxID=58351 RepID=A0A7W7R1C8_KITKI|nr:helix-turn-helix domain-containing protein [Kitasatospora kifunensis]MBB4923634.1 transcriptional regulator GlxA family with amidase domain [Kitasatospora kifunensis]
MLKNVVALVLEEVHPFELGVACEVFGLDRSEQGLPVYDFALASHRPGELRTHAGFTVNVPHGVERLAEADLVIAAATGIRESYPAELIEALRAVVARGARVLSICTGSFLLGAAGLLDGRRSAAHWRNAHRLAERFPLTRVEPDVLYVDEDPVITSAGTAAGIDACLYLVRKVQGVEVARGIAQRMVVAPHREGGQAQYVNRPLASVECTSFGTVLEWMREELERDWTVDQLAARAHMTPRTFARRFQQETGTTPLRWLIGQRVLLAQRLLEETGESVEAVAVRVGFGNAAALRHHFGRWLGTTPQAYRRAFGCADAGGSGDGVGGGPASGFGGGIAGGLVGG